MAKFYSLKVKEVKRETPEAVSILFEIPESLKSEYAFKQGQYVTLKHTINGEELRRSYSICSNPYNDEGLRIAVKQVLNGRFSSYINTQLNAGDTLEVMTPMGNFYTELNENNKKNYILFAGGSGITPMMSIIKAVLQKEPQSHLFLFYGNLNENATIFKKEIDQISTQNSNRLKVFYIFEKPSTTNWPDLQTGLMDKEKVLSLIKTHLTVSSENEYFICGPTPMMDNVMMALQVLNVPKEKIHIEYFTAVANTSTQKTNETTKEILANVTVIMYGIETPLKLSSNGKTILDAALDAGVDVPFACKGAVCCTCRAKLIEGQVKMDANFALTDDEVAQGYILTCQAHPITPQVKVDYDAI
jgi:ring-1,2-phenylacetyl-CoA epoxidase subunit PaaE